MVFQKVAILLLLLTTVLSQRNPFPTFEEYLQYVGNNINHTLQYQLPTDNAELYQIKGEGGTPVDFGSFDFIIVGAGDAGTILARRLTDNKQFNVLLLEAGAADNNFTDIPAMGVFTPNSALNWGYKTVPQENSCQGMRNHQCSYPRGKVLGGTHLLSGMIYARGNRADFDEWAELGNKGWSYDEMLPYFKRIEHDSTRDIRHTIDYHGYNGLMYVNYSTPDSLNYEPIIQACAHLGLHESDINGKSQIGVQRIPWMTKHNVRETGGNTFIRPIWNRDNLKVVLGAFVTEIIIEDQTATGVIFRKEGKIYTAKASKEVIVSAGAINSPQLLMISGVGPREDLERLNITVKNDLPVGKYLSDHPCFTGLYVRSNQTYPNYTLSETLKRYLNGETPLTNIFSGGHIGFINTRNPGEDPPNIEFLTVNPPTSIPSQQFFNFDDETFNWISKFNPLTDFAIYVIVIKPKTRGTVTLKSKSILDFPLINPNFYSDSDDDDIQAMYEGIQFILDMAKTEPMKAINAEVFTNSPRCEHLREKSEMDYWYCAIRQHTNTIFHPTSTTRMGVSPQFSVVDSKFRVHNMRQLRVCDAGAMPHIVAGHPIAAILAMGDKLADILEEEYSEDCSFCVPHVI